MKHLHFILIAFFMSHAVLAQQENEKKQVNTFLDAWHKAAADANAQIYFGSMIDNAIFIGTDESEVWLKKDFESWSKPYFDKGKAWDFTAISRNIYFGENEKMAWFDENLDTWMGVCRGSGVLVLTKRGWKIKHYVLSVTIDNELIDDFKKLEKLLPEKKVMTVIKDLFKAMKNKDAELAKSVFAENARLTTLETKDKKTIAKEEDIAKFIEFIGTPSATSYEERILSYEVKIDADMATVWTPYEFYLNDKFSHCGVNAFQLFKAEEGWKILQITDTRRKKDCN